MNQAQIEFVEEHNDLFAPCVDELIDVLRNGVRATYSGHPPIPPRRRGLTYKGKDKENTELILPKLWKTSRIDACFCAPPGQLSWANKLRPHRQPLSKRKTPIGLSVPINGRSRT